MGLRIVVAIIEPHLLHEREVEKCKRAFARRSRLSAAGRMFLQTICYRDANPRELAKFLACVGIAHGFGLFSKGCRLIEPKLGIKHNRPPLVGNVNG